MTYIFMTFSHASKHPGPARRRVWAVGHRRYLFFQQLGPEASAPITHDAANRAVNLGFEAKQTDRYYLIEGRTGHGRLVAELWNQRGRPEPVASDANHDG